MTTSQVLRTLKKTHVLSKQKVVKPLTTCAARVPPRFFFCARSRVDCTGTGGPARPGKPRSGQGQSRKPRSSPGFFYRRALTCVFFASMFLFPQYRWLKNAFFSAGLVFHKWETKCFCNIIFLKKICFFLHKNNMFFFFFKPNPDVVRYVIADVGPLPEWSATIVLSQKRESKILKRK